MAKTDKKTLELIQLVKQQKTEIANIEKPNWRTNCSFSYIDGKMNDAINIHVETNVKNLILIAAFLQEKEISYINAIKTLNIDTAPEFTWGGFSIKDWLEDLKMRINKIQIASKKRKLETLESRLNAIISPELRAQLELQSIESELN